MQRILRYFPDISKHQIEQFEHIQTLYAYWNARVNIISRKDFNHFYERHVLHSLSIAKVIEFNPGSRVMDVGTGGGFPGIPLAVLFPDVYFHLVDSIGKKINVVHDVIKKLDLKNATAEKIRVEMVRDKFDFIVSRAVTNLHEFMRWTNGNLVEVNKNQLPNGILYLKGGEVSDELKRINKSSFTIYQLSDYFHEDFFKTKCLIHLYELYL